MGKEWAGRVCKSLRLLAPFAKDASHERIQANVYSFCLKVLGPNLCYVSYPWDHWKASCYGYLGPSRYPDSPLD
jgi:hypothetical protein